VPDGIAAFLRTIAATGISLKRHNDLVHQRFVEVAAENRIGSVKRRRGLTLVIKELDIHD
jgi:hypothetical protein